MSFKAPVFTAPPFTHSNIPFIHLFIIIKRHFYQRGVDNKPGVGFHIEQTVLSFFFITGRSVCNMAQKLRDKFFFFILR
jgi:hypothetical protein